MEDLELVERPKTLIAHVIIIIIIFARQLSS